MSLLRRRPIVRLIAPLLLQRYGAQQGGTALQGATLSRPEAAACASDHAHLRRAPSIASRGFSGSYYRRRRHRARRNDSGQIPQTPTDSPCSEFMLCARCVQVMKLTKLFVEKGAAGVHIEDQKPGTKK